MSKTAIITGAGTGIGASIAIAYAEEGYNLVLAGRRIEPLEEIARQCGTANIEICAADVGDRQGVQLLAEQTVAAFGRIDILVNNAGINTKKRHLIDIA
ncbi:MAG: SDR family NAD(P)-dependent oxidoreductase, partial [Gemmatimonadetes bacterium]|nr:SDR family NAD(P)-dependent oxidoreductase [Gemmatimonadota bacterium]